MSPPLATPHGAARIVICDYNALLQSVTGLLRMSDYYVFQAYGGVAAQELCQQLENIDLLVLNTEDTGTDTPRLVRDIRVLHPRLPVLHIGVVPIPGMPADVINVQETFTAERMLGVVHQLVCGEPPRDPRPE